MAIQLPSIFFQSGRPRLNRPMSVTKYGGRALSFVEYADAYWTVDMETQPLPENKLAAVEAWIASARGGFETIHFIPRHMSVPQAYIGNETNPIVNDNGILAAKSGTNLTVNSVSSGLVLTAGDLIGFSSGDYNTLGRVITGATAASTSVSITVEPPLPSHIPVGSTIVFRNPKLNTRIMPNSIFIGDGKFPSASFQLIEVPK
ncbi:hypothetical protein KUG47_12955 [Falsochrobactrum sp. TDYN1]|uniref:Uncharacterized protein n=1 Tax=Falsochrobactrum tianjinense TaxID=2706015 RepID=A0A949UVU3_9HYPH|nr:hypothetical protein [Falsochrobactrum sp. TDYN1]MBV2144403.1 hypothetical protein [Falsochrobactrum sp. TDYN1]